MGLTDDQMHEALGVESVRDFAGDKKDAMERIKAYALKLTANDSEQTELDVYFGSPTFWHKLVKQSGLDETSAHEAVADFIASRGAGYEPEWHDAMIDAVLEWMAQPEEEPLFVD